VTRDSREGLLAAPFDESRLAIVGQPVPVVDGVITNLSGGAHFDVAGSGTLAYVSGPSDETKRQLSWVTRDGAATPASESREISRWWMLSPDGTRVVRNNTNGPNRDIWIDDMVRKTSARITTSDDNVGPIWSHDGRSVIFMRGLPVPNLYRRMADGSGSEERLTVSDKVHSPTSVSPDGKWLAYEEFEPLAGSNILLLPLSEPGTASRASAVVAARPFLATKAVERTAMFAPDGRWLAYESNETGRMEVYVRSFPEGDEVIQVSTAGGISPLWAPSGRELLYRRGDGMIMSTTVNQAPAPLIGATRPLFDATGYDFQFAFAPDGQRLLMMPLIESEASITEVHLVLNFLDELRRRFR
jgi:Tol biopolymer transport system component